MLSMLHITTADSSITTQLEPLSSKEGIELYRFSVRFPTYGVPTPIHLEWEEPMVNLLNVWHPSCGGHMDIHQQFGSSRCRSRFCEGAPLLCTLGSLGLNNVTVALSDVRTPTSLRFFLKDVGQKNRVGYGVDLFTQPCDPLETYATLIRIDRRPLPYYQTVMAVSDWWQSLGYSFRPLPSAAEDPLYSTWYNFYQAPEQESLLEELRIASDLGFKTVILDDGWQFDGPSSGNYSSCGMWQVAKRKFPDFKKFTADVHSMGMKLMVWFAVPFIGADSPLYENFRGKYLYHNEGLRCAVLDPRFPEVRSFLIQTYANFLQEYDIDGFKLDFIDSFQMGDLAQPCSAAMDHPTLEGAVLALLSEITQTLERIKPNLLYEYRMNYIGPAINHFGNMLRVGDCAYDARTNRRGVMALRLLNYPIAVHSDMLLWSPDEDPALCARQLLNILFSVPQISVRLRKIPESQRALLKHYIAYWTENRELIMHGHFRALHPELDYSMASVENDKKLIAALYTDQPFVYPGKPCDVFHVGDQEGLVVENPTDKSLCCRLFDHSGGILGESLLPANGIMRLQLPPCGMVRMSQTG